MKTLRAKVGSWHDQYFTVYETKEKIRKLPSTVQRYCFRKCISIVITGSEYWHQNTCLDVEVIRHKERQSLASTIVMSNILSLKPTQIFKRPNEAVEDRLKLYMEEEVGRGQEEELRRPIYNLADVWNYGYNPGS